MSRSLEEIRVWKAELQKQMADADKEIALLERPQVQPIDTGKLIAFAKEVVEYAEGEGRSMKDCDHWAFETVMEAVYGPDFWSWYNKKIR